MKTNFYFIKNSIKLLAFFMLGNANAQRTAYFSNDTDLPIPDNSTLASLPITVSGIPNGSHLYYLNLGVRMDHSFVGDLTMRLQMPNGGTIGLMHRPGTNAVTGAPYGNMANLSSANMILFDDYSAKISEQIGADLTSNEIIPQGAFRTSWNNLEGTPTYQSFSEITAKNVGTVNSNWTIYLMDKTGGDSGTLTYSELLMKYDDYCVPFFENSFEHITNVSFAGLNQNSGRFAYDHPDYQTVASTDNSTPVKQGKTYPISVSITLGINEYIYAFIDWNQDKDFDDANEIYTIASNVSAQGPHTINITIPEDAELGETRMRIMLGYSEPNPSPCYKLSNTFYGEVEDYTLLVEENLGVEDFTAKEKTIAYPNPVTDFVKFKSQNNIQQIHIYNANGQEVLAQKFSSKNAELNLAGLTYGVYVAKIQTDIGTESVKIIKK
ncbi:GEVED domain-containing protein [Chryseobacterium sp. FH1]|uniref:GEVED domain-containing protein n=1 Tax=Chryseobacterium sp. FH1 TaxID=1233951 RepID=UPI0004E34FEF|nr:GEVED domain-containing protein [Chryseobacterium sp. FH1]KFC20332.1 hypothetical protein IO90_14270 [Chryseobacterium sp. FH1]